MIWYVINDISFSSIFLEFPSKVRYNDVSLRCVIYALLGMSFLGILPSESVALHLSRMHDELSR